MTRQCARSTSESNQQIAADREHGTSDDTSFSEVNVVIAQVLPGNRVIFRARDIDEKTREHGPFEWGDETKMWVYCPSTLPSAAVSADPKVPGNAPPVDTTGMLLLQFGFCKQEKIQARLPKFPRNLGEDPSEEDLRIELKGLVLDGILLGRGAQKIATVDLLDRELVPEQTIVIDDDGVRVRLTQKGFSELQVPVPTTPTDVAVFFPSHVVLHALELDNLREGTVDLIDPTLAPRNRKSSPGGEEIFQTIILDGGATSVRLTRAGLAVFGVAS